jgi:hypothetical protein
MAPPDTGQKLSKIAEGFFLHKGGEKSAFAGKCALETDCLSKMGIVGGIQAQVLQRTRRMSVRVIIE